MAVRQEAALALAAMCESGQFQVDGALVSVPALAAAVCGMLHAEDPPCLRSAAVLASHMCTLR